MTKSIVLFICICFGPTAMAQTPQSPSLTPPEEAKPQIWYLNFGFGYSIPNYADGSKAGLVSFGSLTGYERAIFAVDIGAYWPSDDLSLVASDGAIFGISDIIEASGDKLNITQNVVALSVMKYFSGQIGRGVFGRADIGFDLYGKGVNAPNNSTSFTKKSGINYSIQLGVGYAFPISEKTSFSLGAYYLTTEASSLNFVASCMF